MRSIDPAIITAIESGSIKPFLLLELYIDTVYYRYTDCDVPIVATNRFNPRRFIVDPIQYSSRFVVDSVKIDMDNNDDVFTAVFVGGTPQDSEAILKQILMTNDYTQVANPVTWFQGELDSWVLTESKVSFTITSEMVRWSQKTMSRHSASCRWKQFKGTECTYSGGATWCDRTFARCSALTNTANFGGFRWLPSIIDKEIWWGANREV